MKAHSTAFLEMRIILSQAEITSLEHETLKGKIVIRDKAGRFSHCVRLEVANAVKPRTENWSILLGCNYSPIERYKPAKTVEDQHTTTLKAYLSEDGYKMLRETGHVSDRAGGTSVVDIFDGNYNFI